MGPVILRPPAVSYHPGRLPISSTYTTFWSGARPASAMSYPAWQ